MGYIYDVLYHHLYIHSIDKKLEMRMIALKEPMTMEDIKNMKEFLFTWNKHFSYLTLKALTHANKLHTIQKRIICSLFVMA
mgnify:CR=1 FL=1|jgi:hypothetical protein